MTNTIKRRAPLRTTKPTVHHHHAKAPHAPKTTAWSPSATRPQRPAPAPAPVPDAMPPATAPAKVAPQGFVAGPAILPPELMNAQRTGGGDPIILESVVGPLFAGAGPSPDDIHQGATGDCYFLSTMSAVAATHPEVLQQMVKKNDDGTFTVTFKKPDGRGGYADAPVTVDDRVYSQAVTDSSGKTWGYTPLYATSNPFGSPMHPVGTPDQEAAVWVAIAEKAWATLNGGSFEAVGNGGQPNAVMEATMGRPAVQTSFDGLAPDRIFSSLQQAVNDRRPVTASTDTSAESVANFTNTGLVHGHAYTVMGAVERDGEKYVQLRNPWGHAEWGNDGTDDGRFEMKLSDFLTYFKSMDAVQ